MSTFNLDSFLNTLCVASRQSDAKTQVLTLMKQTFNHYEHIAENMPEFPEDETLLREEETITIWHWRAQPNMIVPPHNHHIVAIIGIYKGIEENHFHLQQAGKLIHQTTQSIKAGEVFAVDPESIHSVQTVKDNPSSALHIYLGNLRTTERSLFDWETGEAFPFTMETYNKLLRFS